MGQYKLLFFGNEKNEKNEKNDIFTEVKIQNLKQILSVNLLGIEGQKFIFSSTIYFV